MCIGYFIDDHAFINGFSRDSKSKNDTRSRTVDKKFGIGIKLEKRILHKKRAVSICTGFFTGVFGPKEDEIILKVLKYDIVLPFKIKIKKIKWSDNGREVESG